MTLDILTQVLLCAIIFVAGICAGMMIAHYELSSRFNTKNIFEKGGK
jgi:hypothetical protein